MSKNNAVSDEQMSEARRWLEGLAAEAEHLRTIEKAIKELRPEIMRMRDAGYGWEKISEGLREAGIAAGAHTLRKILAGSRKAARTKPARRDG